MSCVQHSFHFAVGLVCRFGRVGGHGMLDDLSEEGHDEDRSRKGRYQLVWILYRGGCLNKGRHLGWCEFVIQVAW